MTVLGELEGAFALGSRARADRQALAEFLSEPFVSILVTFDKDFGRIEALYCTILAS